MRKKSFKKKNELIEAALDEFITNNYDNASLNKIIKNAGISKGMFYYYFEDKEALYKYIHESAYKAEKKFFNNRMKELGENLDNKDIFEIFKIKTQMDLEFAAAHPKYLKLLLIFMKEEENENNKELIGDINNLRSQSIETGLEPLVKNSIQRGDFNKRFSEDFIIKITNYLFIHYSDIFDLERNYEHTKFIEEINEFIDFLKHGLSKE